MTRARDISDEAVTDSGRRAGCDAVNVCAVNAASFHSYLGSFQFCEPNGALETSPRMMPDTITVIEGHLLSVNVKNPVQMPP